MTEALLVSNALLWCLVIALALVVLALARQVGVLHERVAPAGALMPTTGPKVGEHTQPAAYRDLGGEPVTVGGPGEDGRATLVLWVSPTCPVCKALLPALASLGRDAGLRVVLASDGDAVEHAAFVARERIALPYLLSAPLGLAYRVGKLPWAVLIDAAGIVRAQGLVNSREHLDSLLEAKAQGVASIQEYLQREQSKGAA